MCDSVFSQNPPGLLLINKPKGITSFDIIRILRKRTGLRKMGHGGTLDKNATGLVIIGIGSGTKKLNSFLTCKKEYVFHMILGAGSDTHDWVGHRWWFSIPPQHITKESIQSVLKEKFTGCIQQEPPLFSSLKKNGKQFYKYALKGENIEIPSREINIDSISASVYLKTTYQPHIILSVRCSKGTYVRALARDIGKEFSTYGVVKDLCRTKIGSYSLANSIPLSHLQTLDDITKGVCHEQN